MFINEFFGKKKVETVTEGSDNCPPATQDIALNLENRKKAIDEYGYGPLNPALPNTKFWMHKVNEWNLDSADEAKQSLCGNCAAFDVRQNTLDCIAQGIDGSNPEDAAGVIDAGDLGYCKFLKFKCASQRTCDAWVTGGPLTDEQGVAEGSNDYFKRRKDEEDRIAGAKAPAKRTPKQTDYEKKRKQQGVEDGSKETKPKKPITWQQAYAHNDGESFDARQKRITQYEKSKGNTKPRHVDWGTHNKLKEEGVAEGLRGTGNPGMPRPYDQGRADAKKGRPYDNPYDQPGEQQEHNEYKKGYEQGKQQGVAEGNSCNMTNEGRYCSEHGMMECPGYGMTETSVQDKLHQQHQELRKQRGLPDPSYYKKLAAQKQAEIDALRAEIAADQAKSMKESLRPGERHHYEDDPKTGKRVYKGIRGDQFDAPKKTTGHEHDAERDRAAHRAHDRSMTESIERYMEELERAGYGLQEEKTRLDPKY